MSKRLGGIIGCKNKIVIKSYVLGNPFKCYEEVVYL